MFQLGNLKSLLTALILFVALSSSPQQASATVFSFIAASDSSFSEDVYAYISMLEGQTVSGSSRFALNNGSDLELRIDTDTGKIDLSMGLSLLESSTLALGSDQVRFELSAQSGEIIVNQETGELSVPAFGLESVEAKLSLGENSEEVDLEPYAANVGGGLFPGINQGPDLYLALILDEEDRSRYSLRSYFVSGGASSSDYSMELSLHSSVVRVETTEVPEPGTIVLFGLATLSFAGFRRRVELSS